MSTPSVATYTGTGQPALTWHTDDAAKALLQRIAEAVERIEKLLSARNEERDTGA